MVRMAIICAMRKEYELLKTLASESVKLGLSGIGKVNSAVCTDRMIREFHPDCVLNVGVSGALDPGLAPGDVIIASSVQYHDVWCGEGCEFGQVQDMPLKYLADENMLLAAVKALPEARVGNVISGDQFYLNSQEDGRQKRMFPEALAVDMESASVAQVCHSNNVPCLSLRIISDVHDCRQAEHYEGFWDELAESSFAAASLVIRAILLKFENSVLGTGRKLRVK